MSNSAVYSLHVQQDLGPAQNSLDRLFGRRFVLPKVQLRTPSSQRSYVRKGMHCMATPTPEASSSSPSSHPALVVPGSFHSQAQTSPNCIPPTEPVLTRKAAAVGARLKPHFLRGARR